MGKGYAEGSAVEERLAALERGDDLGARIDPGRGAVYGSTEDEPERHFIGWADEVDADELFASGRAWGLQVVRRCYARQLALPLVEQALDVAALRVGELEARDDPARLGRVVVLDRRLEPLAQRVRLAKLAAQPAEQADLRRAASQAQGPDLPLVAR